MEFIEKFAGANSFASSFTTGSGDDVGLIIEDIILYTLLPFGQLIMRMYKYGGSLDKPYLLLLMFPSFGILVNLLNPLNPDFGSNITRWIIYSIALGWIAPLMGYFKLINKVEDTNNLDAVFLMPIFFRFIVIAVLMFVQFDETYLQLIIHTILFSIMMLTNFVHLAIRPQCNSGNNKDAGSRFLKVLMDTTFQYGIIFFFMGMLTKTKNFASEIYEMKIPIFDNIGVFMESISWIFGAMLAYITTNMIDANYNTDNKKPYKNDDVCKGDISALRYVFSVTLFITGLTYYLFQSSFF